MTLKELRVSAIRDFINTLFGASYQGSDKSTVGLTLQPVVDAFPSMVYKVSSAVTSTTTVWTPAAHKSILLKGGLITVSKETTCAGALNISLNSGKGGMILPVVMSAAALTATGVVLSVPFCIPSGLRLEANDTLAITISAALTAGAVSCGLYGNEI